MSFAAAAVGANAALRKKRQADALKRYGIPDPRPTAPPPPRPVAPPRLPDEIERAVWGTTNVYVIVPEEESMVRLLAAGTPPEVRRVVATLEDRLYHADEWPVAAKCLLVFHRLLRDGTSAQHSAVIADNFLFNPAGLKVTAEGTPSSLTAEYCRYLDVRCGVSRALRVRLEEGWGGAPSVPHADALLGMLATLLRVRVPEVVEDPVTALILMFLASDAQRMAGLLTERCLALLGDHTCPPSVLEGYSASMGLLNDMFEKLRALLPSCAGLPEMVVLTPEQMAPSTYDDVEVCSLADILGSAQAQGFETASPVGNPEEDVVAAEPVEKAALDREAIEKAAPEHKAAADKAASPPKAISSPRAPPPVPQQVDDDDFGDFAGSDAPPPVSAFVFITPHAPAENPEEQS